MARRLGAVAWLGVLLAALVAIDPAGTGPLAPPPATPAGWEAWAAARTPVEAAAAVLRLAALGAAAWLLATTVLGVAAGALRWRGVAAAVARWSPPVVRRVVRSALGAGLASALVAGPAGAEAAGPPPTMVLLPGDDEAPPPPPTTVEAPSPPPAPPPPEPTVVLVPGDHLWSVAERTLAAAWSREPSDREVTAYWRRLVTLNRADLPDPDDPDLVFPGDVVRLPPVA